MSFAEALAAPEQPERAFAALEQLVRDTIGARLFTIMVLDHARGVAQRLYSSHPEAYPVTGEKPMPPNAWTALVIDRREVFVANTRAEIAAVFPDHDLIASLGCESCLNLPVVAGGAVLGTLNCLHAAGHYTPARVAQSEALALPGVAALLTYKITLTGPGP